MNKSPFVAMQVEIIFLILLSNPKLKR
jgi:hypothetical protein